ncbi:MAG: hypothetical protein ABIE68_03180 [bacterium]
MNDEQWDRLKEKVKNNFEVVDEKMEDGEHENETIETIEVKSDVGRVKFTRASKPKVLDVKATYAKRGSSVSDVQYTHSETDMVHTVKAYRWNDQAESWDIIDTTSILNM